MTDPAIRAALDAAGEAVRETMTRPSCCMEGTGCELPPCHCSRVAAAAAVAAFLRDMHAAEVKARPFGNGTFRLDDLAAAVEAEAGDEVD